MARKLRRNLSNNDEVDFFFCDKYLKNNLKVNLKPAVDIRKAKVNIFQSIYGDNIMIVQSATRAHDDDIIRVWESSVRATHHFLTEEKIAELKIAIKDIYLPHLAVFVTFDSAGNMTGFLGCDKHRLEMLFISQENRGQGTGKKLLQYAIDTLGITELDVNEQNPQAIGFYQNMGFKQYARSELDGEGNPFPILHMRLNKESA